MLVCEAGQDKALFPSVPQLCIRDSIRYRDFIFLANGSRFDHKSSFPKIDATGDAQQGRIKWE